MNKQRRVRLGKVLELLEQASEELNQIAEEEREAFDNLPLSIQESERGCVIDENASILEDCSTMLNDDILLRLNEEIQ